MDRDLPLKPTLAFLACFVLAIIVYAYYAPITVKPPIGQLYTDADDRIWVLEKNRLLTLAPDRSGQFRSISLEQHGINQHIGQLIPLKSGEFIINSQGQSRSMIHHIRRFLRLEEDENTDKAGSLHKCDADFVRCTPWGEQRLFFDVAWSGLELSTGQIILNDTARHRVLLLSADGDILSEADGFKFPNHAIEDGDNVWIVDTNHNRLVALTIDDQQLRQSGEAIYLSDYTGIQSRHNWPSVAALDVQKNWWVMVNDSGMAHPIVYRLNADKTATPFGTQLDDASFMLLHDGQLYISQYPENVVWAFNQNSGKGNVVTNAELTTVNYEVQHEISANKRDMWLIIAAIAVVGVGVLAYAIKGSSPAKVPAFRRAKWQISIDPTPEQPSEQTARKSQPAQLIWIDKNEKFMKKIRWVKPVLFVSAGLILIGFATLFFIFPRQVRQQLEFTVWANLGITLVMMIGIFILAFHWINTIQKRQLGVMGNYLFIRHGNVQQAIKVHGNEILYTPNELYAQGIHLPWQNQQNAFFDKSQFEQYVVPVLQHGKRVNAWQLLIARLKGGDIMLIVWIVLIVVMLVATFLIKI